MAQEAAIRITADGSAVVAAAKQAESALQGLGAQAGKMATSMAGASQSSEGLTASMRELDKSATRSGLGANLMAKGMDMATGAILAAGAAVGASFVGKLVAVQREFDVLNSSLVTVSGSSAAAAREMSWLKDFAKETPFGLAQATQGFVKMKALGLDPSKVALTSFGNTASAMGKDLNQMVEAVADATTGEFERLKEFGIKAKVEGDQVALTFQGVTTTIGNSAAEINKYLIDLGNNQFGGAMAERAKTLDGTISGLADSWDELFRTIGSSGVSQAITNELTGLDNYLTSLTDHMNAAKASGSGMVGELSSGLGYLIARAPFDVLSSSANLLNGTLNLLTGGALGLNTSVNLLPDAFKTSAQQAAALAQDLKRAETEFAALKAQADKRGSNIYIQSELASLSQYIAKLKEAQAQKSALTGNTATRDGVIASGQAREQYEAGRAKELTEATKALNDARLKAVGVSKEYVASIKVQQDALRLGLITEKEATTAIGKLVQKQYESSTAGKEAAKSTHGGAAANQEAAKAAKELEKAYTELVKTAQTLANAKNAEADGIDAWFQAEEKARLATVKAANDSVQAAQDEYDNFGRTKSQIAEVTLARLQDKLQGVNAGTEIAASIGLQIEAQQRLIGILQKGEVRDAGVEAAKDAAAEWKKTTDDIGRGLTDSLFRAFEAGKGFFSTLWSGIKNLFKTTVLKMIISPVTGAITGAMGLSGAANAATGSSSLLSGMGSLANIGSSIGAGISQTIANVLPASISASLGMTSSALAASNAALIGGGASASAAASAAAAAGNGAALGGMGASMTSALAAIPGWGWAALAAVAVAAVITGGKKDSRIGGGYSYDFARGTAAYGGGPDKSFTGAQAPVDAINATVAGINGLLKTIGSSSSLTQYYAASETSNKGRGGVMSGGMLSNGVAFGEDNAGSNYDGTYFETSSTQSPDLAAAAANFATDLKQSMIQALQAASGVPESIARVVRGIDAEALSDADVSTLLNAVNGVVMGVEQFRAALSTIGLSQFADIAFDAASAIAAASGGFEPLLANLSSYYDTYSTEGEKAALVTRQITQALAGVNIAMPATRAEFKSQVEAALALGEAGAPAVAALLSVNQAFASVTPEIESVAAAVDAVAASISDTLRGLQADATSLQIEIMRKTGNAGGADYAQRALDTTGYSAAELAVYDYNNSLRAQISTLDAAAAAAQAASAAAAALTETNQGWTSQLDLLTGKETDRSIALRDAGDDSTRALMHQVYAQQDLKTATDAATAAASALTATNQGWINQLAILTGAETDRSIALREAGDDSTRALMRQVYAQQDLKTATDGFIASEKAAVASTQAAVVSARTDLVSAYKAEASAMQSTVDKFRTFSSSLRSFRDGLLMSGLSPLTPAQRYAESKKQFDQAQAGGGAGQIQGAASAFLEASKVYNASSGAYVSDFQAVQAALTLAANNASATADVAQLQLDAANSQLDLLGSINSGVMSVADALAALAAATAASSVMSSGGALAGAQGYSQDWMQNAIHENLAAGYTPDQIITGGMRNYGVAEADIRTAAKAAGIPGFRIGTNYVPHDMLAQIHEGEAIVPKAYNPAAGGQQGNAALEAKLEAVLAELRTLREQNNQGHAMNAQATVVSSEKNADTITARQSRAGWSKQPELA